MAYLPTAYRPELQIVEQGLERLATQLNWKAIQADATPWVQAVRDNPPPFWAMESLLKEYPISSNEGLALMRLAEALLRVPDAPTAIALTADQLGRADFEGSADSALARLSSAAIAMSKHFLPEQAGQNGPSLAARLGSRTVVAATLRAVQLLGKQFVLGQNIDEAQSVATQTRKQNARIRFSYDMLGEGARTQADADRYFASYQNAITQIAKANQQVAQPRDADGISIKLSALHPRYEYTQRDRVLTELLPRVWQLCEQAARANINLTIDAEEVDRLELSLDLFEALLTRIAKHYPQWHGFGLALQAYQTRALALIDCVVQLARKHQVQLMCRLVKGAYWDAEIKRAQEMGLPHYPVFTHKHHTDISYLSCAKSMLAASDVLYSQFATHNAATIAAIMQMAAPSAAKSAEQSAAKAIPFELQRLHGMGEGIYREVLKSPHVQCRVYAPVGAHRDLLAYLVRRLLENGANSSFVHQLADESVGMDLLLQSPLHISTKESIGLPLHLFRSVGQVDQRKNSRGLDLADQAMSQSLRSAVESTQVPQVQWFNIDHLQETMQTAQGGYAQWSQVSIELRCSTLERAADALENQMARFCALLILEAHKTWGDAVAEVREAIDFLRYYANQARHVMQPTALPSPTGETNVLQLKPRGVWLCISPWNFPLAIFLGQVSAALATGNSVIAKPAEQTPAVAVAAVELLHQAGVPHAALQLAHGAGETVGALLVSHRLIAGVVFTGSTPVAKIINRTLAAKEGPITPLIAETGGVNAMIVDSSALPEQVCDAVIQSAFRSAGQRCSALRLLCIHEAIASHVIEMIRGAAAQLITGSSQGLSTDVAPLIDREAADHVDRLKTAIHGKELPIVFVKKQTNIKEGAQAETQTSDSALSTANLIDPAIYEVEKISDVTNEIFGPVLQVVRWTGDPLAVVQAINQLGFGLTLGIQTRIDSRANAMAQAAHIGNVYINRNMIGAVVGVQPFGGEGLSGTGPKAGGPHYLYRFCAEQTITINTAAAGGNATLLASMKT
jgi:RHH-type transcriptional regulator, proline utilization regulon repressor / proline dehydrogenase / delta 1-pyrroline-5-carboxylate dehydrogenase